MISFENQVFYRPKEMEVFADDAHSRLRDENGDHLTHLKVYNPYAANGYSSDWCQKNFTSASTMSMVRKLQDHLVHAAYWLDLTMVSCEDSEKIRKAIMAGFFLNVARLDGNSYRHIKSKGKLYIHHNSVFGICNESPRFVFYNNIVETTKDYMHCVMKIQPHSFTEVAPDSYNYLDFVGS